jgi:hypothetical protein
MKPNILTQSPVSSILSILRLEIFIAALLFGMALPSVANDPTPFPDPAPFQPRPIPYPDPAPFQSRPTPFPDPAPSSTSTLPYSRYDAPSSKSSQLNDRYPQAPSSTSKTTTSSTSNLPYSEVDTSSSKSKFSSSPSQWTPDHHGQKASWDQHKKHKNKLSYDDEQMTWHSNSSMRGKQKTGKHTGWPKGSDHVLAAAETPAPRYSPIHRLKLKPQESAAPRYSPVSRLKVKPQVKP